MDVTRFGDVNTPHSSHSRATVFEFLIWRKIRRRLKLKSAFVHFLLDLAHVPGSPSRPVCSLAWPSVSADIFSESLLDALTMESLYIPSRVTVIKRLARLRLGLCVCQCVCSMFNLEKKEKRKRKNNSHCVATACLAVSRFRGERQDGANMGWYYRPSHGGRNLSSSARHLNHLLHLQRLHFST